MKTVTVSPEVRIVIPQAVREALNILPGQKLQMILHERYIALIPLTPMHEWRGFLQGIETSVEREAGRT